MLIANRGGSGSGSGVGSVSGRTRPIKLRAACTQCNAGKVKCSGEKTGCERCRNLDLQCIYMESRVGKVPGVRARKRSVHQHINIPRPDHNGNFAISQSMNGPPSASTLLSDGNDSLVHWATDSNGHGSDIDLLERTLRQPDDQMTESSELMPPSSIDSELILPEMDFDIDDLLRYPNEQSQYDSSPTALPVNEEQDGRRRAELDSQCVLVCCQIASELESYMVADIKSLRIVLGIVRKGVERLNDAVGLQQGSRNFRCMAMFGVILYQIIELLESGCACFLDKTANRKDSFAVQIQGMLPGIALGGFGMDPEEQSSWRSHIVLKEIQQTSEVLNRIKKLMAVGESGASKGPSTPEEREKCFVDLEIRLKALSEKVASPK
ncbi:hypothetical protein P154DRAFT_604180 [Amniculicola lignicola CBS 123094]|uniref:Zn(2)-C6 fungal-type domain-containing protein n=1 Tax=Amniculicola lignicola CBS 123094 TaxID=1392246 RepID=A0A6A5W930_9PLEO|nr:hypothetical protein P154DRAFT_604180 [Amniculicola lignicola CBS 123094]